MEMVKRFIRDERGLETIEYSVIAAIIVIGIVALLVSLKGEIGNIFGSLKNELVNAQK